MSVAAVVGLIGTIVSYAGAGVSVASAIGGFVTNHKTKKLDEKLSSVDSKDTDQIEKLTVEANKQWKMTKILKTISDVSAIASIGGSFTSLGATMRISHNNSRNLNNLSVETVEPVKTIETVKPVEGVVE